MYCSSCIFEMTVTPGQEQLVGHRSLQPRRAGRGLGAAVSPPLSEIYIHSWPLCISTAAPWSQQAFRKQLCSISWKKRRYLYIKISPPKGRAFPEKRGKPSCRFHWKGMHLRHGESVLPLTGHMPFSMLAMKSLSLSWDEYIWNLAHHYLKKMQF